MSTAVQLAVTLAGWTGALATVFAYGMVTAKRITPDSLLFQGLNIAGASLLAVSASTYGAWPSAVVNVIWVAIGIFALLALLNQRSRAAEATAAAQVMAFDGAEQDRLSARQAEEFLALEDIVDATDLAGPAAADTLARNSAHRAPVAA